MSGFLEWFFELEGRQRALALIALGSLSLGGYWYFVYSPRQTHMAEMQRKVEDLQGERSRKLKLVANLDAAREQVRELTAKVRQAEVRLPDQKEIPDLLSSVSTAGREAGLEILLFRQRAERFHDFYAEVPVEVLVRGTYHQVALFFDRVSQLDRIVNVSDIAMKEPEQDQEDMVVNTSCSAVTFRFLDEAERERIAKEKEEAAKKKKGRK